MLSRFSRRFGSPGNWRAIYSDLAALHAPVAGGRCPGV